MIDTILVKPSRYSRTDTIHEAACDILQLIPGHVVAPADHTAIAPSDDTIMHELGLL